MKANHSDEFESNINYPYTVRFISTPINQQENDRKNVIDFLFELSMIKKHFKDMFRHLTGLFFILLLSSCQNDLYTVSKEEEDANFLKAKVYMKEGRKDLALETFLKVTKSYDYCPESHFELGLMFLNDFSDPISSIYHFRKYLQYSNEKANSKEHKLVTDLVRKAKLEFAKTLPGRPIRAEIDRVDLLKLLEKERETHAILNTKIGELEKKLSKYEEPKVDFITIPQTSISATNHNSASPTNTILTTPQVNSYREHKVQPGDTLSKISQKFYGNRNQWEAIYQANRGILSSPSSLKPGQKLRIP